MIMGSLVDDLSDVPLHGYLHFLLRGAIGVRALVITPWVFAPFDLLLSVFSPVVAIVQLLGFFYRVRGRRRRSVLLLIVIGWGFCLFDAVVCLDCSDLGREAMV